MCAPSGPQSLLPSYGIEGRGQGRRINILASARPWPLCRDLHRWSHKVLGTTRRCGAVSLYKGRNGGFGGRSHSEARTRQGVRPRALALASAMGCPQNVDGAAETIPAHRAVLLRTIWPNYLYSLLKSSPGSLTNPPAIMKAPHVYFLH